jgi:putative thioredoxin
VAADPFQREVIDKSHEKPVVVDFWAPWCAPCRVIGPALDRLAKESKGAWRLVKINVDKHQALAGRYGIRGIPAVKLFRDGRVVDEFVGALPELEVRAWVVRNVPTHGSAAGRS